MISQNFSSKRLNESTIRKEMRAEKIFVSSRGNLYRAKYVEIRSAGLAVCLVGRRGGGGVGEHLTPCAAMHQRDD